MAIKKAMSGIIHQCRTLSLSFSGAGHLLPYHLGAAIALKEMDRGITHQQQQQIHAVSGSSSGALAASAFVYFTTNQIKEYAERFISDGGKAMFHFKKILDEDYINIMTSSSITQQSLHIATTRCSDGSLHLFDFPTDSYTNAEKVKSHLLACLEASCKIPRNFHPADVLPSKWPSTYSDEDGIVINGQSFCDGGISAPAPPTPLDSEEDMLSIIVSPISGSNSIEKNVIRISPRDDSWKFPMDITCRGGFRVHPSLQNLSAMQVSAGMASESVLRKWYEKGMEDLDRVLADVR